MDYWVFGVIVGSIGVGLYAIASMGMRVKLVAPSVYFDFTLGKREPDYVYLGHDHCQDEGAEESVEAEEGVVHDESEEEAESQEDESQEDDSEEEESDAAVAGDDTHEDDSQEEEAAAADDSQEEEATAADDSQEEEATAADDSQEEAAVAGVEGDPEPLRVVGWRDEVATSD